MIIPPKYKVQGPVIAKVSFNCFSRSEDINIYLPELASPQSPLESLRVTAPSSNGGPSESATQIRKNLTLDGGTGHAHDVRSP